jgi:hypothetical protein
VTACRMELRADVWGCKKRRTEWLLLQDKEYGVDELNKLGKVI